MKPTQFCDFYLRVSPLFLCLSNSRLKSAVLFRLKMIPLCSVPWSDEKKLLVLESHVFADPEYE